MGPESTTANFGWIVEFTNISKVYMNSPNDSFSMGLYEGSIPKQRANVNILANTTLDIIVRNITSNVSSNENVFESKIIIPLYVTIFLLSVIGNTFVLITLVQNKRMRTVTNVYLLNLAVADLLLGVFCMPFTLVGQVLRNFIFGAVMCKLIPYFQAVSVSVAVWTLVAISLERYFAICRSLKSRRWQTQFHAYKMITIVWISSLIWSVPISAYSSLKTMKQRDGFKCREDWPTKRSEQVYNIYLDSMLLFVPLVVMTLAYSLIISKLWKGLRREIQHNNSTHKHLSYCTAGMNDQIVRNNNTQLLNGPELNTLGRSRLSDIKRETADNGKSVTTKCNKNSESVKRWFMKVRRSKKPVAYCNYHKSRATILSSSGKDTLASSELQTVEITTNKSGLCSEDTCSCSGKKNTFSFNRQAIRSNYMDKSIESKKKVIRMLFAIVLEFFICWAPLHILNTWYLFYPETVYKYVGSTGIALVQLLAYISSCCHPITYCFMNKKFRQSFLAIFHYHRCCCCPKTEVRFNTILQQRNGVNKIIVNNSDVSMNDSILYLGRASTIGRSEVLVLEAEERV